MRPMTTASFTVRPTTVIIVLGAACGCGSWYSARNGLAAAEPCGAPDGAAEAAAVAGTDVAICDVTAPKPSMATNTTPSTTQSRRLLASCFNAERLLAARQSLGGIDDVGDAHAEVLVGDDDLTSGNQPVVDQHVYRLAGYLVELHHGARP